MPRSWSGDLAGYYRRARNRRATRRRATSFTPTCRRRWRGMIPSDAAVLEVGCAGGDLLAALPNPAAHGGRLCCPSSWRRRARRHPELTSKSRTTSRPPADVRPRGRRHLRPPVHSVLDVKALLLGSQRLTPRRPHLPDHVQLPVGGAGAPGGARGLKRPAPRRTGCPTPTFATSTTSPVSRWCGTRIGCCCRWTCRRWGPR